MRTARRFVRGWGRTAALAAFLLTTPDGAAHAEPATRRPKLVPALSVAVGLGTMATGAWLLGKDGQGTCAVPADAPGTQCPRVYDTMVSGITLVSLGFAVAAAGGFVLVFGARREASLALSPAGFTVAGRF